MTAQAIWRLATGFAVIAVLLAAVVRPAPGLSSAFTYQGQVIKDGSPVDGTCDLRFKLFDAVTGGSQIGNTQTVSGVSVSDGLFTVQLNGTGDFGAAAFAGEDRWLEIAARCPSGSGNFSAPFTPRQQVTAAPNAIYAVTAGSVPWSGLTGLSCANGQVAKWSGSQWACADDQNTTYDAGAGLTLSGSTLSIASNGVTSSMIADGTVQTVDLGDAQVTNAKIASGIDYTKLSGAPSSLPPSGSAGGSLSGSYPNPSIASNSVGSAQIQDGSVSSADVAFNYAGSSSKGGPATDLACSGCVSPPEIASGSDGQVLTTTAGGVAWQAPGGVWSLTGNSSTTPGTNFLGTTDSMALELKVSGARALRLEPNATSPNVIGGFSGNAVASGKYGATIGGGGTSGHEHFVGGNYGTVGGGYDNTATGDGATVAGGEGHLASGIVAAIGGGNGNTASGTWATVAGGADNHATADGAAVGGGRANQATAQFGTIGGGGSITGSPGTGNRVTDDYGTVGGGTNNQAGDNAGTTSDHGYATVGGGYYNTASGTGATVAGGEGHLASGVVATIGGGNGNYATANYTTVAGGANNYATTLAATVGGGQANQATGSRATVGGGFQNVASAYAATVPGGENNTAGGAYSFAAGRRAKANNQGCFVLADATDADEPCVNDNRFVFRVTNAFYIWTTANHTTGVVLPTGGAAWSALSDRNAKENFTPVDGRDVLARLASVPVETWNLKSQPPSIRHIGPMAQDFSAAFSVGEDSTHISSVDADGVALAAIQGLYRILQEKDAQIAALEARLAALERATGHGLNLASAADTAGQ